MTATPSYPDYPVFLAELKERILHARTSAVRAVNRELILLYWDIGHSIVEKQQKAGWGESVVERLAADLRRAALLPPRHRTVRLVPQRPAPSD